MNKRYDDAAARAKAQQEFDRLLSRFDIVEVDRTAAVAAGDVIANHQDRGVPLHDLHDVYVGAAALVEQVPVLTANVDHFEGMDDVTVVDWEAY